MGPLEKLRCLPRNSGKGFESISGRLSVLMFLEESVIWWSVVALVDSRGELTGDRSVMFAIVGDGSVLLVDLSVIGDKGSPLIVASGIALERSNLRGNGHDGFGAVVF